MMLLQILGVLLVIIGLLIKQPIVFMAGGCLCLVLAIFSLFKGMLKLLLTILFCFIGFLIFRSWKGILFGAMLGQGFEIVLIPFKLFFWRKSTKKINN